MTGSREGNTTHAELLKLRQEGQEICHLHRQDNNDDNSITFMRRTAFAKTKQNIKTDVQGIGFLFEVLKVKIT